MDIQRGLAIACESGGFRCAFVHGVLEGFERAGLRAAAYGAVSASVVPAAFAAIGRAADPGFLYWLHSLAERLQPGNGMSEMILEGLAACGPDIEERLFDPDAARLVVAACRVVDPLAAAGIQGSLATRIGRAELLAMARHDDSWARKALSCVLFDSRATDSSVRLGPRNFRRVAYASTRMIHAWRIPAEVDGQPYVDGSYRVSCPVPELLELGYPTVVAVSTHHDGLYTDLYGGHQIERECAGGCIDIVAPERDLKDFGVDFTMATAEGLRAVYEHGVQQGESFAEGRLATKNNRDAPTPEFTSSPS